MRLIDADVIKIPKGFFEKVDNVPKFYDWLDDQPTVDPVKHGRWEPGKEISRTMLCNETIAIDYEDWHCSVCGRRYKEYVLPYRYCPHCGAKMDLGGEEA